MTMLILFLFVMLFYFHNMTDDSIDIVADLDHGRQYEDQRLKEVLKRRKISQARSRER